MKQKISLIILAGIPALSFASGSAHGGVPHLDGSIENLSIFWIIPFVGILLSIAMFPLVAPNFWHHNFGKISAFWVVSFIVPFLIKEGFLQRTSRGRIAQESAFTLLGKTIKKDQQGLFQ